MIGKVPQSSIKPSTLGVTANSSTYGQTIPVVYGMTRGGLYLIWAANVRKGSSGKKGKKGGGKKGAPPTYVANCDCLIAHNPLMGVLQVWNNNQEKLALNTIQIGALAGADFGGYFAISDSKFYAVIGVTYYQSVLPSPVPPFAPFDDYGAPGQVAFPLTSWQVPVRNVALAPPTYDWAYEPFGLPWPASLSGNNTYAWTPAMGAKIFGIAAATGFPGALHVYYAQIPTASWPFSPLAQLRLTFEPTLGDGTEYGSTYAAQQILYPQYCGVGSPNFDLGSGGLAPQVRLELLGPGINATGDADFADIVADICGKATSQAAIDSSVSYTYLQRGLPCAEHPGIVYRLFVQEGNSGVSSPLTYWRPNTAGNILLVTFWQNGGSNSLSVSDSAGNTWTPVFGAGNPYQVWYAVAGSNAINNTVTISGIDGNQQAPCILEIAGVDAFDTAVTASGSTASITTSNDSGMPAYLFSVSMYGAPNGTIYDPQNPLWPVAVAMQGYVAQQRVVNQPGTYTLKNASNPNTPGAICILSFKATKPAVYPKPLGSILDYASLLQTRDQCRAFGLWGSLIMDSQKKAADWLDDLYTAMIAAPVWSGFKLKSIPMSEASWAGNGAVYTTPTSGGPVANLTEADFIAERNQPPVAIERKARVDIPNLVQIQHPNRASDYNSVVTSQPETGAIAMYGQRKDSPKVLSCVQDVGVARMILGVLVRRANANPNTYKFKLQAKWKLLEAMDLITIPLSATMPAVNGQPATSDLIAVRLTKVSEDEKYQLDCEAEQFIYGLNSPTAETVTQPSPFVPSGNTVPANVNKPIIFEPLPRLSKMQNENELWLVVSDSDASYGGCIVYLSTDGGNSYKQVGTIQGNAPTGYLQTDWPAADDPDTTNDLLVDLTESLGVLASYQQIDEDNFVYPCYVSGGTADPASLPYELMTYAIATLTAPYKYTLKATGSTGSPPVASHLRRAVFGAPMVGSGALHTAPVGSPPVGSRFAFLDPAGTGILKLAVDPLWFGQTLHFKFVQFNQFGSGIASLSAVSDYTYTLTGAGGAMDLNWDSYSIDPATGLVYSSSTTITLAGTEVSFKSNRVRYTSRLFIIPAPSSQITYYVTAYDPGQIGEEPGQFTRTFYCDSNSDKVGVPGYVYFGSITLLSPEGTIVTPGGWPAQQVFLVNGT